MTRLCIDCSGPVSRQGTTGRCARCSTAWVNSDPVIKANRKRAIREYYKDPAHRAKNARRLNEYTAAAKSDPAKVAVWTANVMKARQRLNDPDVLAKMAACRAENGRKRHETVMGWCPPEYRAEYKRLTLRNKIRAADARAMIEELMRMSRYTNGLTIGKGKCAASECHGANEEATRRLQATLASEAFLAAQRRYELRLADKVETELCGGLPPQTKAHVIETELATAILTKHERELMAIANGAGITELPPVRKVEPQYSLVGCGTALL